jgi:uncharacterized membrane protein YbhN (UPF0104 family)
MTIKRISFALKVIVSGLLLIFAVKVSGINHLDHFIPKISSPWFVQALVMLLLFDILGAIRLTKAMFGKISLKELVVVYLVNLRTYALAIALPGDAAGFGARVIMFKKHVDWKRATLSIFVDKFVYVSLSVGLGFFLSFWHLEYRFLLGYFGGVAVLLAVLYRLISTDAFVAFCRKRLPVRIADVVDGIQSKVSHIVVGDFIWISTSVAFLSYFFMSCWIYFIALQFNVHVSLTLFTLFTCTITLLQLLPISIGGIGLREIAMVSFLGYRGVNADAALSIGLSITLLASVRAVLGAMVMITFAVTSGDKQ